ncbi:FHA domain-containing protein [Neorhizobium alkalisoli]|uniref:FHA domain-containing protein n=1 Tax=Neorhizobium alkalisoli TaxID=528178 RepID=UPI000CF90900|nr:FHA domain-containing protein [Neorhizobium alkalisoli]
MRLELKPLPNGSAPLPARQKWFLERGRRTLGRAPDCDWQVPEDQRSVSKVHCVIERDSQGYLLRDRSANGSKVDGVVVHEGEVARLTDQSRLELGNLAFLVEISGRKDEAMEDPAADLTVSDEPLTISAILADIAPGGSIATGILGERAADEWAASIPGSKENKAVSRQVEIGWSGPPEIQSALKIIPDDWLSDLNSSSDYGSQIEHGAATRVAVPIGSARTVPVPDIAEYDPPSAALDDLPPASPVFQNDIGERLEPLLGRLEETIEDAFALLGLNAPPRQSESAFPEQNPHETVTNRLEMLLGQQLKLNFALRALVHEAGRTLEPRVLEARVDAGGRGLAWNRGRQYWQAYRAQFDKNGKTLSILELFQDAMAHASGRAAGVPSGTEKEEGIRHEE